MARVYGGDWVNKGRSVRLYLADGKSSGILTAEIMNWTGHVLAAPRTRLEDALAREELRRTGVYLLIGPDLETDLTRVYVGEGDEIGKRLYSHNKEKDFWERCVAITSKDMNLTKAHGRYLEGRLLKLLQSANRCVIENKDLPQFDRLPEADIADMEAFLEEIQLVLPVIGVDVFRQPPPSRSALSDQGQALPSGAADTAPPQFVLTHKNFGITATAREVDGEFIIEAGSIGAWRARSSFHGAMALRRNDARSMGRIVIAADEKTFQLTQDIAFSSPSAAAVFLFGTSRNGRTDWQVDGQNIPYGDWKDQIIAAKSAGLTLS